MIVGPQGSAKVGRRRYKELDTNWGLKAMSKKHLRQLKELQRIQKLHEQAGSTVGGFGVSTAPVETVQPTVQPMRSAGGSSFIGDDAAHAVVRRDLMFLSILIAAMVVTLVVLNWLVQVSALGGWLLKAADALV